jgi:hypothetical protein
MFYLDPTTLVNPYLKIIAQSCNASTCECKASASGSPKIIWSCVVSGIVVAVCRIWHHIRIVWVNQLYAFNMFTL